MHPILAERRRLFLYLLVFVQAVWILVELLRSLGTVASPARRDLFFAVGPVFLVHAFSCLASFYLCRTFPLGESRAETVLGATLVSAVLASGAVVALGLPWTGVLAAAGVVDDGVADLYASRLVLVGVYALFLYLLSVALHYLFLALERSRRAEARAFEARLGAREAELQALRAQVDPHFLFNSLNSVAALVGAEPKQARRMCARLASFLRRTLQLGERERIGLGEELSLADDYLEVEQIRFGERLRVVREIEDSAAGVGVPPLVLQPLVENAVRHGIARLVDGGEVRIRARRRPRGDLVIEVENPYDGATSAADRGGVGLENVRRRLRAAYGDEASLQAEGRDGVFRVRLALPAESPKPTRHGEAKE